jgi:hypothetical protein
LWGAHWCRGLRSPPRTSTCAICSRNCPDTCCRSFGLGSANTVRFGTHCMSIVMSNPLRRNTVPRDRVYSLFAGYLFHTVLHTCLPDISYTLLRHQCRCTCRWCTSDKFGAGCQSWWRASPCPFQSAPLDTACMGRVHHNRPRLRAPGTCLPGTLCTPCRQGSTTLHDCTACSRVPRCSQRCAAGKKNVCKNCGGKYPWKAIQENSLPGKFLGTGWR